MNRLPTSSSSLFGRWLLLAVAFATPAASQQWVRRTEDAGPPYLLAGRSAVDLQRNRLILTAPGHGTWEWNSRDWAAMANASATPSAFDAAAGFDGRSIVVFGGTFSSAAYTDEMWRWRGETWERLTPTVRPSHRSNAAMAYDHHRDRLVLFGGDSPTTVRRDTWEWDGTTWTENQAVGPMATGPAAMAYDAGRRRVMLVVRGAAGNETWDYDGAVWQLRAAASATIQHLAYDAVRQRVVGGGIAGAGFETREWDDAAAIWVTRASNQRPESGVSAFVQDAWSRQVVAVTTRGLMAWDGTDWSVAVAEGSPVSQVAPVAATTHDGIYMLGRRVLNTPAPNEVTALWSWNGLHWQPASNGILPAPRSVPSLAYDSARRRLVSFGGLNGFRIFGETWEWTSTTGWQQRNPSTSPAARWDHALAFDAARGRIVLFGGVTDTGVQNDTWTWDGTNWQLQNPVHRPVARRAALLIDDPRRARVVLVGDLFRNRSTWEWDGTDWSEQSTTSPEYTHTGCFDSARSRVTVVARNAFTGDLETTWDWDGQTWTRLPALIPAAMQRLTKSTLAYDARRQRSVLVGSPSVSALEAETWMLTGVTAAVTARGAGCGSPRVPMLLSSGLPIVGRPGFALEIQDAAANAPAAVIASLATADLAIGACRLLIAPDQAFLTLPCTISGAGIGQALLPLPDILELAGATLHTQAFALDNTSPPLGIAFTRALQLTFGD